MKVLTTVLALAVSLAIVGTLSAQEKKKGKRPERPAAGKVDLMRVFRGLDLSAEQVEKLKALMKEYAPKYKAIAEKREKILTPEQKKARAEARKEAIKDKKTRREVEEAGRAAMKITDEQKAAMAEVRKEMQATYKEMLAKGLEYLTPEQREKIKQRLENRGGKKPQAKKGAAKN